MVGWHQPDSAEARAVPREAGLKRLRCRGEPELWALRLSMHKRMQLPTTLVGPTHVPRLVLIGTLPWQVRAHRRSMMSDREHPNATSPWWPCSACWIAAG